jgi:alpha-galactosidase
MDGALHLHQREKDVGWAPTASSSSYDHEKPTNVYIHGYQSWSFSGSVVQGKEQPKSAMPNVLSAAFNRGGVVLSDEHAKGSDYWSKNVEIQINDDNEDSEDDNLNEENAFYKSDMFACISSNGVVSSQHDNERIVLDEEGGPAVIIGFLAQRQQYGSVLLDKDLRRFSLYSCHEGVVAKRSIASDWAYCQIVDRNTYDEEAMVYYVHAVGDHNEARPMEKGLTCGWCSWYHYYDDISHESLSRNADILENSMTSLGFNVCLIDDGYMTAWGDWTSLKPGRFVKDGGMRVLSDAIRAKGMKPGVWLAPFACDKHSTLAKDHPDWIIRNDTGRHANSANCGKFFYGLDATNPAVLKHVYDAIRRAVDEWGFDVLKLDFLYASCLAGNGKFDPSMSRAEAMYLGLRTIRSAAGKETFIIGCGCPIGSAVGFVDGMRVSCDTGPTFVPPFPFPHWGEQQCLLRTFPDFLTTTTYVPLYFL